MKNRKKRREAHIIDCRIAERRKTARIFLSALDVDVVYVPEGHTQGLPYIAYSQSAVIAENGKKKKKKRTSNSIPAFHIGPVAKAESFRICSTKHFSEIYIYIFSCVVVGGCHCYRCCCCRLRWWLRRIENWTLLFVSPADDCRPDECGTRTLAEFHTFYSSAVLFVVVRLSFYPHLWWNIFCI